MAYLRKNVGTVTGIVTQEELDSSTEIVRQDLNILALREAVTENRVANNLPNSFIDHFQDDAGIDTESNTDRNASEYVGTIAVAEAWGTLTNLVVGNWDIGTLGATTFGTATMTHGTSPDEDGLGVTGASASTPITLTASVPFQVTATASSGTNAGPFLGLYKASLEPSGSPTNSTPDGWKQDAMASLTDSFFMWMGNTGNPGYSRAAWGTGSGYDNFYSDANAFDNAQFTLTRDTSGVFRLYTGTRASGTLIVTSNVTNSRDFTSTAAYRITAGGTGGNPSAMSGFQYSIGTAGSVQATGTMIGIANVPSSSRTKVSGVMLYKDDYGTATISSAGDLQIYFTCNGGTNWTEASSYTAISPVFSSLIKMVKLGETTCTSGSDVRYKAVWANQVLSTKQTTLHGIGLNY